MSWLSYRRSVVPCLLSALCIKCVRDVEGVFLCSSVLLLAKHAEAHRPTVREEVRLRFVLDRCKVLVTTLMACKVCVCVLTVY